MTEHPKVTKAPGVKWRPLGKGWEARWRPRADLVARGYLPTVTRLWAGKTEDITKTNIAWIGDRATVLQEEMLVWARGGLPEITGFDGTVRSLIACYKADEDSTYQGLRHHTKQTYESYLRAILTDHGTDRLSEITARDLRHWHKAWAPRGATMAHGLVGMLRTLMTYGATILDDKEGKAFCRALKVELHDMRFSRPGSRNETLSAEQVIAIREKAREMGFPSIALAQAFQFECTLRQRDVIGEWVPENEPGISEVLMPGEKWLRGIRWSEIDGDLILRHLTSKRQKVVVVDLKHAPMVLEELAYIGQTYPEAGPIIVRDGRDLPWQSYDFRRTWRQIANAAGIPKGTWNMDSRAGAITEATDSGAQLEDVRHAATHSNISMTQKYSRGDADKISRVMQMRVASRNKEGK